MEHFLLAELLGAFFVLYMLALYIYRMYLDALSHIPGPKLAAASLWYEFYYDVVLKGQYTFEIRRMHEKYGPIIRINPYEIHINDVDYINTVYPGSSPRTMKYAWTMKMFGLRSSFLVTESHELHRIRRAALAHYFSKSSLQKLEPGVQSQINKMVARLQGLKGSGRDVNLLDMYTCLTADVIGQYCFAKPYELLDDPDFAPWWHRSMMDVSQNGHILKQFGFLLPLMQAMPHWLVRIIQPQMMALIDFQVRFRKQVIQVKSDIAAGKKLSGQTTIFYDVLTNPNVRPQEKEIDHLSDEAQTIIGAGTATTGHILAIVTFYLIKNPSIRTKLEHELGQLMATTGGSPEWHRLEQLPYLTAVITEALRIGYGVSHRLQRLFPDTVLQYHEYAIPIMTPVSMTTLLIHDNTTLFPDPRTFDPERFIQHPELKKYLLPFSRGSRQCAGLNLAYAEFYLTLAAMFAPGRFDWELFETDMSDVETVHDFLNTSPRLDSKGIRVLVK